MTSKVDLGSKEEGILLVIKTFFDLVKDHDSLDRPLGKVEEPLVALVGL